ncbi:MAG: SMI1/KNR4 family protein [Candidatus Cloacimonadota bacterium]|nr:SMI1/KNR4 family protein [Candidatus Cloacimonadota bacterium]
MMKPYRIVKTIDLLDAKIEEMPDRCFFNEGASAEDIMDFEVDLGIDLPLSYKIFLNNYDGDLTISPYGESKDKMVKSGTFISHSKQ